jgi:hypothetical protein
MSNPTFSFFWNFWSCFELFRFFQKLLVKKWRVAAVQNICIFYNSRNILIQALKIYVHVNPVRPYLQFFFEFFELF